VGLARSDAQKSGCKFAGVKIGNRGFPPLSPTVCCRFLAEAAKSAQAIAFAKATFAACPSTSKLP
jgi:hypothetical protein